MRRPRRRYRFRRLKRAPPRRATRGRLHAAPEASGSRVSAADHRRCYSNQPRPRQAHRWFAVAAGGTRTGRLHDEARLSHPPVIAEVITADPDIASWNDPGNLAARPTRWRVAEQSGHHADVTGPGVAGQRAIGGVARRYRRSSGLHAVRLPVEQRSGHAPRFRRARRCPEGKREALGRSESRRPRLREGSHLDVGDAGAVRGYVGTDQGEELALASTLSGLASSGRSDLMRTGRNRAWCPRSWRSIRAGLAGRRRRGEHQPDARQRRNVQTAVTPCVGARARPHTVRRVGTGAPVAWVDLEATAADSLLATGRSVDGGGSPRGRHRLTACPRRDQDGRRWMYLAKDPGGTRLNSVGRRQLVVIHFVLHGSPAQRGQQAER